MNDVVAGLIVVAVVLVGAAGLYFQLTRPDSGVMQRRRLTPTVIAGLSVAGAVGLFVFQTATGSGLPTGWQVALSGGFGAVLAGTLFLVERARRRSSDGR
ncbi:hypothetical protein GCU60_06670 [Blastococcus saxobsidens]|uniref:Uncharacterized protein n=1 Tax=Blastococcus saxobsidens TaxID=138336 RepID=A0A6L9W052_9ACTN|nr:hypothetical protein [Blastococcus saxobsidens]NEK85445.1 hypothetical protein [Blastococcus saxobsidens]